MTPEEKQGFAGAAGVFQFKGGGIAGGGAGSGLASGPPGEAGVLVRKGFAGIPLDDSGGGVPGAGATGPGTTGAPGVTIPPGGAGLVGPAMPGPGKGVGLHTPPRPGPVVVAAGLAGKN